MPEPMPATLLQSWERTVRTQPEAPALVDAAAGRVWTRRQLDALASDWPPGPAVELTGRAVAFAEPNGAAWWQVFLGLLQRGAVAIALDPGDPDGAQRRAAASAGASFLWRAGRLESLGDRRPFRDGRRLVKLTSGSTGKPRVLPFTDAQMLADGRQICATMEIRPDDLNLGLIPFGHSYGLGNLVVPLLAQGTAIVCADSQLPQAIAATVQAWRPTVFPAVPTLLRALVETSVAPGELDSLRTVISAGAPLAPELARGFHARFGRKIHNFYGSSETGGITYDRGGDAALTGRSVGAPLEGVRLRFEPRGRFSVESAAVFTLGNRRRRRGRGRHRPADRAQLDAQGELVLLGRTGRFVKVGGRRLNLGEVETALRAIPGVRDAFAALHAGRADALAAAVAGAIAPDALRGALRERLAPWKIPRRLVVLPELPVTARGKTDTRRLRELLGRGPSPQSRS